MSAICRICPHACLLQEGQSGFCGVRTLQHGVLHSTTYGKLSAIAVDPIEKKPLYHYHPKTKVYSIGSYGCNMRCSFCQNHEISMHSDGTFAICMQPLDVVQQALAYQHEGVIGIAYTYNEPLINFEYVMDCCILAHQYGLKNIVVTNGYVTQEALEQLLPYVDAMNIDVKAFREEGYHRLQGDLDVVKRTVAFAHKKTHVEITSLMVPGLQDDLFLLEQEAKWLASIDPTIPLHLTRFFPRYHMLAEDMTDKELVLQAVRKASNWLQYVHAGNI